MSVRLGHLRLDVADLDRQVAFYTEALGLSVHERARDDTSHYAFLTDRASVHGGSAMHHRLVLRAARDGTPPERSGPLDHIAFEVPDAATLWAFVERLRARGVETDLQDARIAWQCYFRDPEGNRLEVYCDRRGCPGGAPFWRARQSDLAEARLREAAES